MPEEHTIGIIADDGRELGDVIGTEIPQKGDVLYIEGEPIGGNVTGKRFVIQNGRMVPFVIVSFNHSLPSPYWQPALKQAQEHAPEPKKRGRKKKTA